MRSLLSIGLVATLASTAHAEEPYPSLTIPVWVGVVGVTAAVTVEVAPIALALTHQLVGPDRQRSAAKWTVATSVLGIAVNSMYVVMLRGECRRVDIGCDEAYGFGALGVIDLALGIHAGYRLATDESGVAVTPTLVGAKADAPGVAISGSF